MYMYIEWCVIYVAKYSHLYKQVHVLFCMGFI